MYLAHSELENIDTMVLLVMIHVFVGRLGGKVNITDMLAGTSRVLSGETARGGGEAA